MLGTTIRGWLWPIQQLCNAGVLVDVEVYRSELSNADRYNRQQLYFSMLNLHSGISAQSCAKKLASSTIAIMGFGGIGSNCALQLANSGIQGLILCDCDKVEDTNLVRQFLYRNKDISSFKTSAALRNLNEIRNDLHVRTVNKAMNTTEDAKKVIEGADCVICTMDNPPDLIKRVVNEACIEEKIPVIFAGFSEHMGLAGPLVVPYLSPCYECQRAQLPTTNTSVRMNADIVTPSFGPLCMAISAVTVDEVIRYVSGYATPGLIGKTLMMNGNDYTTTTSQWLRSLSCPVCGKTEGTV
ncbi:hypothetical protein KIMH_09750 [Bombiscardovia apis]|uniref:THIF-type NAD/FAD binding fold domain-containing protein n=2 Tax=Bombiscardovia apis TaxID=2932182 RepID=A0ABM8BD91_9BIFI|nr:hypothetical protein KIMH_09750 [Bombiscardovia apis]